MSSTWCCRVDERHQQTAALSKFCSSASASATLQSKSAPQAPQYSVALVLKRHLELSACAAATLQKILRGSTILWFWWLFCTLWLASSQQNMNMMVLLPELALNAGIVILVAHNFDRTVNRGARRRWAEKWFQNADTKIHAPHPSSLSALILKRVERLLLRDGASALFFR